MPEEQGPRFEMTPSAGNHFAWLRTRFALERTIIAWVRTAIALIGFGFTIVTFFDHLRQFPGVHVAAVPQAPRYLGLGLIGAGLLCLAVSYRQYRGMASYLWKKFGSLALEHQRPSVLVPTVVAVLSLVGLFAFLAVLLRMP